MHIEEDTCKSTHRKDKTLLDFNRAGVPLIEIVTKPCMTTSTEAKLYLEKLKELLFYFCDLCEEHGIKVFYVTKRNDGLKDVLNYLNETTRKE